MVSVDGGQKFIEAQLPTIDSEQVSQTCS